MFHLDVPKELMAATMPLIATACHGLPREAFRVAGRHTHDERRRLSDDFGDSRLPANNAEDALPTAGVREHSRSPDRSPMAIPKGRSRPMGGRTRATGDRPPN